MQDPTDGLYKEVKEKLDYLTAHKNLTREEYRIIQDEIRMLNVRIRAVERMKKNGVKF